MGSIPPKQTQKINELKVEVEELKNPTERPTIGTPREGMQVIDRQRLMAAWESNVKTLRGVLEQMGITQRSNVMTRWVTLVTLLFNIIVLAFVMFQLEKMTSMVHQVVESHIVHKCEPIESQ